MCQSASGNCRKEKWYNRNIFPLIPVIEIRKADKYNTKNFTFRWLFFTVWSLDVPSIEFAFVIDTHWGIGVVGLVPYLRFVATIPCPEKLASWIFRNLSRAKNLEQY